MRFTAACTSLLVALLALNGCASPSSGKVYSREEARTAWRVSEGEVVDVQPVQIEGQKSWLGTTGGGYIGYELGRTVGSGSGRDLAGAVGGVASWSGTRAGPTRGIPSWWAASASRSARSPRRSSTRA